MNFAHVFLTGRCRRMHVSENFAPYWGSKNLNNVILRKPPMCLSRPILGSLTQVYSFCTMMMILLLYPYPELNWVFDLFYFFFHFFCWLAQYLIKHWMADPPTANQILFVEENKYYFFFNHFFERKMCPPNNEAASWMENHNFPLYHKILSSHKCTLHG